MSLYSERVAKGLCGKCGVAVKDGSLCPKHRQEAADKAAAKRAARKEAGGCLGCGKKIRTGSRCPKCKAAAKDSRQRSIEQRKENGQCVACSNDAKDGCTLCQGCIDARSAVSSEHYRRRKDAGLCLYCESKPLKDYAVCKYHLEQQREQRRRLKLDALNAYGGPQCVTCSCDNVDILEIDHIDGGGRKHREMEEIEGGTAFYQWLKNNEYPLGFRVLCPSCNKQAHVDTLTKARK